MTCGRFRGTLRLL